MISSLSVQVSREIVCSVVRYIIMAVNALYCVYGRSMAFLHRHTIYSLIIMMLNQMKNEIFEIAIFSFLLYIQTSNFDTAFWVLSSLSVQNLE